MWAARISMFFRRLDVTGSEWRQNTFASDVVGLGVAPVVDTSVDKKGNYVMTLTARDAATANRDISNRVAFKFNVTEMRACRSIDDNNCMLTNDTLIWGSYRGNLYTCIEPDRPAGVTTRVSRDSI